MSETPFLVRQATPQDLEETRAFMIRIFEQDYGYGFNPEIHADVADLRGFYLENPRQCLFVAVLCASGDVIGTAAVRQGGTPSPPHPAWLAAKYNAQTTCELQRVYVAAEHRRLGVGRCVVEAVRRWVVGEGGYNTICLHSNVGRPGADTFWWSIASQVHDARPTQFNTVHFELPLNLPVPGCDERALAEAARSGVLR